MPVHVFTHVQFVNFEMAHGKHSIL